MLEAASKCFCQLLPSIEPPLTTLPSFKEEGELFNLLRSSSSSLSAVLPSIEPPLTTLPSFKEEGELFNCLKQQLFCQLFYLQ